jgi:predicted dehydrogenase
MTRPVRAGPVRVGPVRVGLVGTGHFSRSRVMPALADAAGCRVAGVCSTRPESAERFAAELGLNRAICHNDIGAMVTEGGVELVVIGTPPLSHAGLARRALDAGCHVLCTKPLATSAAEAGELAARAAEAGVVTAMDFEHRYDPVRRYLRHLVREGYLGQLRCVWTTIFSGIGSDPAHPMYYWSWKSQRDQSGGILGASLLLHHLDLLRYIFGELRAVEGIRATAVSERPVLAAGERPALGAGTDGTRAVDAEDTAVLHGELAAGGVFGIMGSWSVRHGSGVRLEAYGSAGTLVLENDMTLYGASWPGARLGRLLVPPEFGTATDARSLFTALFADVAAAIRGRQAPRLFATFADGAALRQIASAALDR